MSDQETIVDVDTRKGHIIVNHIVGAYVDDSQLMEVKSHYEILVDGICRHTSNDPEDIIRALGHYLTGLT